MGAVCRYSPPCAFTAASHNAPSGATATPTPSCGRGTRAAGLATGADAAGAPCRCCAPLVLPHKNSAVPSAIALHAGKVHEKNDIGLLGIRLCQSAVRHGTRLYFML